jgi:hypothetical protein
MKPFDSTNRLFIPKLTRCVCQNVRTAPSGLKSVCCSIAPQTPNTSAIYQEASNAGVTWLSTVHYSGTMNLTASERY